MTTITEKTVVTSNAYLKDQALILYFDMAETPFVSRFDLDSLAQANFEVTDKKDGIYSLVLRDYSGQSQTIGQFSSKNDAHQALHSILKALLSQPEQAAPKSGCIVRRFLKSLFKAVLITVIILFLLYGFFWLRISATHVAANNHPPAAALDGSAVMSPSMTAPVPPQMPQGEAMDADEFLKQAAPAAPAAATPKE